MSSTFLEQIMWNGWSSYELGQKQLLAITDDEVDY